MNKQPSSNFLTRLRWGVFFLALLFLAFQVMPRALGQRDAASKPSADKPKAAINLSAAGKQATARGVLTPNRTTMVTVGASGLFFFPSSVTIQAGDTVQWTWSSSGHSSTSGTPGDPDGLWDSGILNQGATFSHTFLDAGSFPYFCSPHGDCCGMIGSVTVSSTCTPGPWTEAAPVSADHFGGFMDSDGIYGYEGGGYSFSTGDNITQFGRFDPVANTWTPLAAVPDMNNALASAVYAPNVNKLFVFGGEEIAFALVVNTTRIYDIATNKWSTGAPMPDVRAFMGAGYSNGKIYLAGGYTTSNVDPAFSQLWEYDTVANTWNTSRASMPVALGGPGSGVINGHLYIAGGRDINNTNYNTLYDYDIAANTWTARANLPDGTNVPSSAVIGGQLWIVGGGNPFLGSSASPSKEGVFGPDTTNILQIYDPATNSWTSGPAMNEFRSFAAGCAVGDTAVAVGGYDGFGSVATAEINVSSCTGGITLDAHVRRQGGNRFVVLHWSPADGGQINVLRNGSVKGTTADDGDFQLNIHQHTGTDTYQVCTTDTGACSNTVTVTTR